MSDVVDPFSDAIGSGNVPPEPTRDSEGRSRAIELGRQLGLEEARRRGEDSKDTAARVARAMAYAAWEHDGKPADADRYQIEFGVEEIYLLPSLQRPESTEKGRK